MNQMSKVKKMTDELKEEIEISDKIRHIPNYPYRFHIIESYQPVKTTNQSTEFYVIYYRSIEHHIPVMEQEDIEVMEDHIRESIKILRTLNIRSIHSWIRPNNIIMDSINELPIISFMKSTIPLPLPYQITTYNDDIIMDYMFFDIQFTEWIDQLPDEFITVDEMVDYRKRFFDSIEPKIGGRLSTIRKQWMKEWKEERLIEWNLSYSLLVLTNETIRTNEWREKHIMVVLQV
jgi:hypothetical protein